MVVQVPAMKLETIDRAGAGRVLGDLAMWQQQAQHQGLLEALPLIDEAEHQRLVDRARGGAEPARWRAWTVHDDQLVGYLGIVADADERAQVELAVDGGHPRVGEAIDVLLDEARRHAPAGMDVWLRQVGEEGVDARVTAFEDHSARVMRRLGIMRHDLDRPLVGGGEIANPIAIRACASAADVDAVVDVLAAAYAGTAEAGWDHQRFDDHASRSWFRRDDILLASRHSDADGPILGVHWSKRRSPRVGEVYNLAVAPQAAGKGVGAHLLAAGLDHLRRAGCEQVLLWVDLANRRAVNLYERAGFKLVTTDVHVAVD